MTRNLTFELVLLNKNNNFYTRNSSLKRPEIKKNKESPKKQTEQPSCSSHLNKGTEEVTEKYKSTRKSKIYKMIPAPCPSTCTLIKKITHTSPILPPFVISVQLTWHSWYKWHSLINVEVSGIIKYSPYTWDLVQALKSAIPCLLRETSHIYWFQKPSQPGKSKESKNEIQLPTNCIVLPWPINTELSPTISRLGTQP